MKQIDLSIVNNTFLETYLESIDIDTIKNKLSNLKYKIIIDNLEDIIKGKDLTKYLKLWNKCFSVEEKKEIEKAFNYTAHRKKANFMEHFKKLKIKSCPFCNNNYIYFYNESTKKINTLATLEHYYPKAKYPHLSLSFYNLIPCCSICNSKFKGTDKHVGKIAHPYFDDFDANVEFRVSVNSLGIEKDIELEVNIHSNHKKYNASIDRFKLNEIYKQHNDIAIEIWKKTKIYNESRIDELYDSFYKDLGYSKEDIKNFVFCNYLNKDDINKRNHSKLTQDILKQFKIIKK